MPVLIAILVLMILISILFARREQPKIDYNRMRTTETEALGRLAADACRQMRVYDSGNGINPVRLMGSIRKANAMIAEKIRKNIPLGESEKWFYENYYLVYRYVYSPKDSLRSLPHIDGVPRIVKIAKLIVNNSLEKLTGERVRDVCEHIKSSVALTYAELKEFNNALSYAILEQIFILSRRLLKQEYYKKAAYRRAFSEKYLKSDVYIYYLYQIGLMQESERNKLAKKGLNEKNALLNFNNITVHNALMAKTLFSGLRESVNFLPVHIGLKYLGSYQTLSKITNLDEVSLNTRIAYFAELEKISLKTKISEEYVAEKLVELAQFNDMDISAILFDYQKELKSFIKNDKLEKLESGRKIGFQRLYCASIFLAAAAGAAVTSIFFNIAAGILAFVPLIFITENLLNYLLSHTASNIDTPKMCYKAVPYRHSATVVVSEFIGSMEQFKESLRHLEEIYSVNGGENVEVALLLDIKGGDSPISQLDNEITEYLNGANLDSGLNVFIRKKEKINGKYQGKERKRGAINALNKLLITKNEEEFSYIYNRNYLMPNYIVTLDADNTLLPGDVTEMVNMMAHPYNKRFDLLSCHSKYNLYSLKTRFSTRFLQESGTEVYPTFSGLYYRLFRRDIYCGKGIYRLNSFYNKLEDVFPSGKILSHDIIEGSVLTTGGGTTVFEDAPSGYLADRERRKRWQRGDIQLLPFLGGRWKNDDGKRCRADIEPVYKFIMGKNILSNLKEICLFTVILLGLFTNLNVLWFGLALFAAPYVVNEIKILRGIASGVLPRYILSNSMKNLLLMTEDFFMLSYYAVSNFSILVGTLRRMATNKNLLEWKTYYNSQNIKDLASYAKEFSFAFCIVTAVAVVTAFYSFNALFIGIYLILATVSYAELFVASATAVTRRRLTENQMKTLRRYADKTYKYFKFMLNDSYIIADNLQIKPYKGVSQTTSPTNIGFSMLAEICAYKLGFVSLTECCHTLNKILDAIEKLPKWHGNLYNWYNVLTLKPVNNFVSSVDSGNFLASVMIVKEFFKENFEPVGELKAELTLKNANLSALFDRNKNLFYLGYDGDKFVGHYDLLNSESRILSTVYVALTGNAEHFRCLQRDYTSFGGNTLLSWSGTMFEALMPDLFFGAPKYSTLYNTAKNNTRAQSKTKFKGVWGISESGYYRFDEELRYQYYAFGLNKLALRNEKNSAVISPYSSALCLNYLPDKATENLIKLENMGCFYEYGFYESADLGGKTRFVSSYMSHHQGMILCAITNLLCENELQRLLKNNLKISAVLNLYNELTPQVAFGLKSSEKQNKIIVNPEEYSKYGIKIEEYFHATALTDTQYSTIINGYGGGFSKYFDIYLNRFFGIYEENDGAFFFIKDGEGKWYSPTYLPFGGSKNDFSFGYNDGEIIHTNELKNAVQKVALLNGLNGEVRKLSVRGGGSETAFFMPIALNTLDGFRSHPAFNGIFTEAIAEDNILLIRKRGLKKDAPDFCVGVRVEGVEELCWECNSANFIGRNGTLKEANILFGGEKTSPSLGDVLNPCVGFRGKIRRDSYQVSIMFAEDAKSLLSALNALPDDMYSYALLSSHKTPLSKKTHSVLGELLYLPYSQKTLNYVLNSGKRDIFGEKTKWKKLIVYYFNESKTSEFAEFIVLARDLNVLRLNASFAVAVKPDLPSNYLDFIEQNLKISLIKDYCIVKEDDEITKFAFITLNQDLSFTAAKSVLGKNYELENSVTATSEKLEHGSELFKSGNGGFDEYDSYIEDGEKCANLPYSNVICSANGGMLTTDNGGGFFYFGNSRENKMSRFDNDYVLDRSGEFIFARTSGGVHKINGGHGQNRFNVIDRGKSVHVCRQNGLITTVKFFMVCDGRARVVSIDAANKGGGMCEIIYGFFPVLNWVYEPDFVTFEQKNDLITVRNLKNNQTLYVKAIVNKPENLSILNEREITPYLEYYFESENEQLHFLFTQDTGLAYSLNERNIPVFEERELNGFKSLSNIDIKSELRSFNILARFLPYQIVSSRLRGKLGFYQVGGATGFRDQLQDCAAFLHSDSGLVKAQIITSARHQYEEGDVMHWWHHPKFGLRTRITDDKLFLPLITAEYVEYTGDRSILEEQIPYLVSPILNKEEETRFENPPYSDNRESLLKHCLRAIRSALKYGEHGLLVMDGGDWNDGMDYVCSKGKGESVFNSMLCYQVLIKFAPLCSEEISRELKRIAEELKAAVNAFAYEDDRYKRLFTDDGRWLGSAKSESLTLDLLVQSYAVLSGIADGERANTVLDTAKKLIDTDAGIIKLLEPPLNKSHYLGYISAYPAGVRENGGQYTHAAIWYLIALTECGRQDEAFELFQMINPVEKCRNKEGNDRYKGEPYVLSGDVYANGDNYGRMGWSWYTGSAAWAYRLIVEGFYGLKREGNKLIINPRLPTQLDKSVITYRFGDSIYVLEYRLGNQTVVEMNGVKCDSAEIYLENGKRERVKVEAGQSGCR